MYRLAVLFALVAFVHGRTAPFHGLDWRVVGGQPAAEGEIPYQASIRALSNFHFCGGIIIGPRTILTASHCLRDETVNGMFVVVGTNRLNETGYRYTPSKLIMHPEYDSRLLRNDIGLVILEEDMEFGDKVQPIPIERGDIGVVDVVLSGWGTTTFPGYSPNDLQRLDLLTIPYEDCKRRLVNVNPVYESQICTLTKAKEGACHGDSGGPLTHNGHVVGIVSWGHPCAKGVPDVFTRVSSFANWIDENSA